MTIQEILVAHRFAPMALEYAQKCIGCDWQPETWYNGTEEHRAHVAEVLEKHMREREAAVIAGLAELMEECETAHNIAECTGYVEGETGRQSVIENWERVTDEPAEWLREQSKLHHERGFDYLRYVAYEAWNAGEEAGWENGRNSYMKEQGFIEDLDPIENPYADEEPNGR